MNCIGGEGGAYVPLYLKTQTDGVQSVIFYQKNYDHRCRIIISSQECYNTEMNVGMGKKKYI